MIIYFDYQSGSIFGDLNRQLVYENGTYFWDQATQTLGPKSIEKNSDTLSFDSQGNIYVNQSGSYYVWKQLSNQVYNFELDNLSYREQLKYGIQDFSTVPDFTFHASHTLSSLEPSQKEQKKQMYREKIADRLESLTLQHYNTLSLEQLDLLLTKTIDCMYR